MIRINHDLLRYSKMSKIEALIKKANDIKVDKVGIKQVSMNIRWLDIKGKMQSDIVILKEGDKIEF
ncbi:hypothetical protein YTPLAS73_11480 [Nitrosarchaeum sp.]|nr:hypothetical protein YTPLAS73_11480 [Nitrosarchaeum sp.]